MFAHRGGAQIGPENTLAAYQAAIDAGKDAYAEEKDRARKGIGAGGSEAPAGGGGDA